MNMRFNFKFGCGANGLVFAALLAALTGCGNQSTDIDTAMKASGNVRLPENELQQLNYCYVLIRSDVAGQLDLTGYQRVQRDFYATRLKHYLTFYESKPGDEVAKLMATSMNDVTKKISRVVDVSGDVEAMLTPEQRETFEGVKRTLELKQIKPMLGAQHFVLKYSLQGDERYKEVETDTGKKVRLVLMEGGDHRQWPGWLNDGASVFEALVSDEPAIRRAGLSAMENLPLADASVEERRLLADALWDSITHPEMMGGVARADTISAFSDVADATDTERLKKLVAENKGQAQYAAVAGLCRIAPDVVIDLAVQRADEFIAFSAMLKGCELCGAEAEPVLMGIDEQLGGKQRTWIQRSLRKIGSAVLLDRL